MARSVAELLPRRFEELELEDVAQIIATIGEERETLFFERKAQVTNSSLAKACAAFANTSGGLLVVGVANQDDTLAGIDPIAAEAQLWVKDVLRGHLLPLPPFRARWLATAGDKGILLVLVEESSTTPHLLIRSGAIYVRNPGSSDPVPLSDQRRLLDLTARGREASQRAEKHVGELLELYLDHYSADTRRTETLAVSATGIGAEYAQSLFTPAMPERISTAVWDEVAPADAEERHARWMQHYVAVERWRHARLAAFEDGDTIAGAIASRQGGFVVYRGYVVPENDRRGLNTLRESTLRRRFEGWLAAARGIMLDLGAHGDLRLVYRLSVGERNMQFDSRTNPPFVPAPAEILVERWTDLTESITDDVFDEVALAAGLPPYPRQDDASPTAS